MEKLICGLDSQQLIEPVRLADGTVYCANSVIGGGTCYRCTGDLSKMHLVRRLTPSPELNFAIVNPIPDSGNAT